MITEEQITAIEKLVPFVIDTDVSFGNTDDIAFLIPPGQGLTREMYKKLFSRYIAENASDDENDERNMLRVEWKNQELKEYFDQLKKQSR